MTLEIESEGATSYKLVDLSLKIRHHFRWERQTNLVHSIQKGDIFDTSHMSLLCHAFTHADAPSHISRQGDDISEVPISTWIGPAAIVDLSDVQPEGAIDARLLAERGNHVSGQGGDIVLLRTDWESRVDIDTVEYWERAPYVTRDAAEWLAEQRIRCVGFDFPQDYPIRYVVGGRRDLTAADFVTHDILLRSGIGMVEYLGQLRDLAGPRTFFVAAPLRLEGLDGSPVRAFALERGDM